MDIESQWPTGNPFIATLLNVWQQDTWTTKVKAILLPRYLIEFIYLDKKNAYITVKPILY